MKIMWMMNSLYRIKHRCNIYNIQSLNNNCNRIKTENLIHKEWNKIIILCKHLYIEHPGMKDSFSVVYKIMGKHILFLK